MALMQASSPLRAREPRPPMPANKRKVLDQLIAKGFVEPAGQQSLANIRAKFHNFLPSFASE